MSKSSEDLKVIQGKIVFIGDEAVGKTCIVGRSVNPKYSLGTNPTLGASYTTKSIDTSSCRVEMQIWDTAGQEKYRTITPLYFRGADVAVVVFSLTDPSSLDSIGYWCQTFQDLTGNHGEIVIVGNKADLPKKIDSAVAEARANDLSCTYIETSAMTGSNIEELFTIICDIIVRQQVKINKPFVNAQLTPNQNHSRCC